MDRKHEREKIQSEIDELKRDLRRVHQALDFEKFWTLLEAHPLIKAKKAQLNLVEILIQLDSVRLQSMESRGADLLISRPVSDLCDRMDLFEITLTALNCRLSRMNSSFLSDEVVPEQWTQLQICRTKLATIAEHLDLLNKTPIYKFRGLNTVSASNWSNIFALQAMAFDCSVALDSLEQSLL